MTRIWRESEWEEVPLGTEVFGFVEAPLPVLDSVVHLPMSQLRSQMI